MRPALAAGLLAFLLLAAGAVVKPWPPAPPDVARLDVEEVYQFDGAPDGPPWRRAPGEDVLVFDFGDEGEGEGEAEEWRLP